MAMQLEQVVPFGRSFDEYQRMFKLTAADLRQSILSLADGPASFNAEGTAQGCTIQSIDPLYCFSAREIHDRFDAVVDGIMAQIEQSPGDWTWSYHRDVADLRQNRIKATEQFCADFELGKQQGRYAVGELPQLNYAAGKFGLGLCSHFLFLYSAQLNKQFHIDSMREMLRVCQEVRVFPLLTLMRQRSPHLEPVIKQLQSQGYQCTIETVEYELQHGGNQMLRVTRG